MPRKICAFTKIEFDAKDPNTQISPFAKSIIIEIMNENPLIKKEIMETIKADPDLKFDFLDSILGEEPVLKRIAKELLKLKLTEIGIGGPGTIADYFCGKDSTQD